MKAARFVVDTHCHVTTLYRPWKDRLNELGMAWDKGQHSKGFKWTHPTAEPYDNSPLCLYDMETYGVDMCILKPSFIGTTNEMQAKLVDKYPDKFRAMCSDQNLKIKLLSGEAEWSLEAALEEVEAALNWGKDKFVGIGEFIPQEMDKDKVQKVSFRERFDEWRAIMDLAVKYGVTVDYHEGQGRYRLLSRVAAEYPEVPIILCHGGGGTPDGIRRATEAVGRSSSIYLETGCWCAEYFEIPMKNPNVGVTQLIWGHDYGNVPQMILSRPASDYHPPFITGHFQVKDQHPHVPYQTDWWGWSLHQIERLKDTVTQDKINLIMGGNAAKIFKLPVPHPRMFPCGRHDIYGVHWEKSIPFLPAEQIQNPDTPQPYRW